MTLLGKMDRLVYATGFDRLLFMKFEPRSFRWAPLFVITALIVGYYLMAEAVGAGERRFWIGWLTFYSAFLAAGFLRLFGPRFMATELRPLDERELMVKLRAYAISGIVFAGFGMLGCFYMAAADPLELWSPHLPYEWINLGFGVQAAGTLLPTLIASWVEPRPAAEQEE